MTPSGLPPAASNVTVSYTFRRQGFPSHAWSLMFRTDPPGASIPPTALMTHPRMIPLSVDDGEVVTHFPEVRDGVTFSIEAKIDLSCRRARIFAGPRAEADHLTPIRLRHPEAEDPRA